jgi:DNA-directed RNA polymerase subunit K
LEIKTDDKSRKSSKSFPTGYTRFEKARIIGARALQIAMGAPVLIKTDRTNPIEIAMEEFNKGVIPITVRRRRDRFIWLEDKGLL